MAYDENGRRINEQSRTGAAVQNTVQVGALLGAGALGVRYRSQIGRGVAKTGGVTASAISMLARKSGAGESLKTWGQTLDAFAHATDQRGLTSHIANPKRFQERFNQRSMEIVEDMHRNTRSTLGGKSTEIEQGLFDLMSSFKTGQNMSFRALQQHKIQQSLKKDMPDFWEKGLKEILNQKKDDFFDDPTKGKIEGMLKQYVDDAGKNNFQNTLEFKNQKQRDSFVDKMFDTLKQHSDRKNFDQKEIREIETKTRNNQIKGFKKDHSEKSKSNWFTKVMEANGYEQMKLKHALASEENGRQGLFDADSMRRPTKSGVHVDAKLGSRLRGMASKDEEMMDLVVDRNIFVDKQGKMLDLRAGAKTRDKFLTSMQENTQIPFLRFNPLDLMHFNTMQAVKEAPKNYFFRRGTIDVQLGVSKDVETYRHPLAHNQDAAVGVLSKDYMYSGGDVYDILSGEVAKSDVYLTSARFGMFPRVNAGMANLKSKDLRDRGFMSRLVDVGSQETESTFARMASTFTKFNSPDWGRNTIPLHKRWLMEDQMGVPEAERVGLDRESTYKKLHSEMEQRSTPLSDDAINYLNQHVKEAYGEADVDLRNLNDFESIMGTLGQVRNGVGRRDSDIYSTRKLSEQINDVWNQYRSNPSEFLKNKRVLSDNAIYVPGDLGALDPHNTEMVSKLDDVKRLIHQHAIEQVEHSLRPQGITVGDLLKEGIESGELRQADLSGARNLRNLTEMRQWWNDVYRDPNAKEDALYEFSEQLATNKAFERSLTESVIDFNPNHTMGPGQEPPQYFGYVGFQTMNKAKGYQWGLQNYNEQLKEGLSPLAAMSKTALEIAGQPFAGRKNMDKVTTLTSASYYMTERLDNALAQIGLGLSQENRGSMQSILMNQLGKRIVLPYVAYQQAMYFDGLTGDLVSDKLADTYVNMHQDVGSFKEMTGLNRIGSHFASMLPGIEQVGQWPIVAPLKHATFGFIGDNRSGEELEKYYESGEDPIRKGRWWGVGSNTPWMGGKIDRYEANWYRKLKSDYKFTETMYGSESEYWANHWMPTLTNPLAPIRHFVTDPNHYAEKHKDSRPYPVMGGGFSEFNMIPVIGPALNATVGKVLNPEVKRKGLEKDHREYLEKINESITAQYNAGSEGGYLEMMPAGGYNIAMGGETGIGVSIGEELAGGEGTVGAGTGPGIRTSGAGAATSATREMLTMLNENASSGGPSLGAGGAPFGAISSLDSLRDPDIVADLADIGTMGSASGVGRDVFYSASEVAGIYGFSLKSFIGFEESGRGMTLDTASRMTSYARAWWDLEMGGRGGMLSEIGRRYNPRDPNKNYWNPIKNEMPDWLPGVDYFTDFQHGDPYVKIAKGEMRLPGEAYETINQLHPDAFGDYGAFDRFKILADVAPYSKEYKFYRRIVSKMNQAGLLEDDMVEDYATVRDQVSEKKKKYNFYNRRFDNADITKEEVTITKVIDANTFITKEYGMDNPIKLAGVQVKASDEEATQWLSNYIYEGAKVTVGLDEDPLFRVRDDMMNTMRAVVYSGNNPEMPWYMTNKGANLNHMLANRDFGATMGMFGGHNNVSIKDDGSATSTRALFSDDQVTVGKIWEQVTHSILPAIPVVGTIADKFMQIRSPLEFYKRQEVYGKAWRSWSDPIDGWINPMLDTIASKHPVVGAFQGAGIGWLATRGHGKFWGTRIGAVVGGGLSTARVFNETIRGISGDSEAWLPARRVKEREINEYFDKLKYVKYKGLYEKARKEALRSEGVDIEELISVSEGRGGANKAARKTLETTKKYLAIAKKLGYGDDEAVRQQAEKIRDELKMIEEDRPVGKLGEKSLLALRYRAEYESTLHGADPHGDMTKIFRALPAKDREFFTEFMKAAPKEREEILRLVPEDQRRFYQAKWGMEVDEKESLDSYFSKKHLPDENWAGWKAGTNLESIKVKVVKNEGLELTEFGLWDDDVQRAEQERTPAVNMSSISHLIEVGRLEKTLRGAGLDDVSVSLSTAKGENKIDLAFDIMKDRSNDMIRELNNNIGSIFG